MHASISPYSAADERCVRPLSRMTTCSSSGPSTSPARRGPLIMRRVRRQPLAGGAAGEELEQARRGRRASATSRSMPISATWTLRQVVRRAAVALVRDEHEGAGLGRRAKFAPVMPTSAPRNVSRSCRRAARGELLELGGRPVRLDAREELGDVLLRLLDRGRDDVDGVLARELDDVLAEIGLDGSYARLLERLLRPISSVAIDFDLAASFAPCRRQTSTMYAFASAAVRRDHLAAALLDRSPELRHVRSRSRITRMRASRARSRSASTSGSRAEASCRCSSMRAVDESRAPCSARPRASA